MHDTIQYPLTVMRKTLPFLHMCTGACFTKNYIEAQTFDMMPVLLPTYIFIKPKINLKLCDGHLQSVQAQ